MEILYIVLNAKTENLHWHNISKLKKQIGKHIKHKKNT